MSKYVIVHFINTQQNNTEFPADEWPPHITLLGNHTIVTKEVELFDTFETFAKTCKSFSVVVGEEDFFGLKNDVLVNKIQLNDDIVTLHKGLKGTLDKFNAIYGNNNFVGDGYRPHSTVQKTERLSENQSIIINSFSVIDMLPNGDNSKRKILRTFNFGSI